MKKRLNLIPARLEILTKQTARSLAKIMNDRRLPKTSKNNLKQIKAGVRP